jgi:nucleoid-associated protein YgaU
MAREYEVRQDYTNHSLSQLLDSPITCFQGVGDIQAQLLNQYFGIASVRQLANFELFLWSLEVQELALSDAGLGNKPLPEVAAQQQVGFRTREQYRNKTAVELMDSPAHAFEGLTPPQDLALYDIFRITNITHLAHNRIMLEARIIQVLQTQEGAPAEGGGRDEVDSVLARRAGGVPSSAVQRITEGRKGTTDERLARMADETTEHIRDRIETLRERARDRAGEAGGRPGAGGRTDSIRAANRMTGAPGEMRTVSVAGRRGSTVATVSRAAELRGTGIAVDPETRAAQVLASRQGGAQPDVAARASSVEAARGAPAGSLGATTVRSTTSTVTSAGTAAPGAPTGVGTPPGQGPVPEDRRAFKPWMAAAAAGAVVIAGILWFVLRPSSKPADSTASGGAPGQQAGQPGTAGPGGQAGQAGPGGQAGTGAGTQPGAAGSTAGTQPGSKPPATIRTVHVVRPGNSLWRISKFYYERGAKWRRIYEENQEQIRDPNLIFPKQKFRIPQ